MYDVGSFRYGLIAMDSHRYVCKQYRCRFRRAIVLIKLQEVNVVHVATTKFQLMFRSLGLSNRTSVCEISVVFNKLTFLEVSVSFRI